MSLAGALCAAAPAAAAVAPSTFTVQTATATGHSIEFDPASETVIILGEARVSSSSGTIEADRIVVDMKTRTGRAEGNVKMVNSSATVMGSFATYSWDASSGTVRDASGAVPPWHYRAERIVEQEPGVFELTEGYLTSCDLEPPHFKVRARRMYIVARKRAKLYQSRLILDDTPIAYTPYYTRSLVPKRYTLRIEPGQSGRDGLIVKSILGYPFTPNSHTRFKYDWLQLTGNGVGLEHRYFNPNIQGLLDTYYIRDTNPDPQPQSRRYKILWTHYQRFTNRLSFNGKVDAQSDQVFGNSFNSVGDPVRVQNDRRGVFSEGGLTYQFPRATLQAQFDRRDRFDSTVSSKTFISKLTVPRMTFNTIPLIYRYWPVYTSFNGTWVNETVDRGSPTQSLRYQRSATAGVQMQKDLKVDKKTTLTPTASFTETWRDRDIRLTTSTADIFQGRYSLGGSLRRRLTRSLDGTVSYTYGMRLMPNRWERDINAADRGIETNQIGTSFIALIGRSSRLSLSGGYTLLDNPRNDPRRFRHDAARFTPPVADLQVQVAKNVNVFFRETYSVFDTRLGRQVFTPLNTSGEIQFGDELKNTFFSQAFSYSKRGANNPTSLVVTNRLKFYLTPAWHIDFYLSYILTGPSGIRYRKARPNEKSIAVARDLHCWVVRGTYSDRPGRREAFFFIDLKANLGNRVNEFVNQEPVSYFPFTDPQRGVDDIFPTAVSSE